MPRTIVRASPRRAPSAVVARIASRYAVRGLPRAVPSLTVGELEAARDGVRTGVEAMPDLLRAGFALALMATLVGRGLRLRAVRDVERFGKGLALAAVFDSRAADPR